ncbi:MAG: hypothetical protein ABI388_00980 [Bacteroidia bacterium]
MRHLIYILFFLVTWQAAIAQDDSEGNEYDKAIESRKVHTDFKESLFSFRFSTTLPTPMSNGVLRTKFRGIYEVNLSFNLRLANNFFAGFGFKNAVLGANAIPNPDTSKNAKYFDINTKMHMYTGYLKVGYNKFHTENIFSTFALNLGFNTSNFTNVVNPKKETNLNPAYSSMVIEPEYSLNFAVEENFSIGIFVSYNFMPTVFNPNNIAFQDVTSLTGLNQTHITGILNFGFGFYYGLGKKFTRRDKNR